MDVQALLNRVKAAQGIETDSGLASAMGVTKQAVSNWRHGTKLPDAVACATIAGLTGEPLAKVLGIVGEARAITREEKAVWKKLASAVVVVLALGATALPMSTQAAQSVASDGVGIMRSYRSGLGPCQASESA
ncbi:MAG TPA: DUF3693 domain-containing protein [Luteimonas sp.]|nr:DUF3693 domain-containing protein [Luteimonas sp.]